MAKESVRIECVNQFVKDLKSGKAIEHQPVRKQGRSKWYHNQPNSIEKAKNNPPVFNAWG